MREIRGLGVKTHGPWHPSGREHGRDLDARAAAVYVR